MITMTREPETLRELYNEIVAQLKEGEVVEITLTKGDGIHELLDGRVYEPKKRNAGHRAIDPGHHSFSRTVHYRQTHQKEKNQGNEQR